MAVRSQVKVRGLSLRPKSSDCDTTAPLQLQLRLSLSPMSLISAAQNEESSLHLIARNHRKLSAQLGQRWSFFSGYHVHCMLKVYTARTYTSARVYDAVIKTSVERHGPQMQLQRRCCVTVRAVISHRHAAFLRVGGNLACRFTHVQLLMKAN